MGLHEALNNVWSSDYVQKNPNKAYKTSYANEYAAVAAYLNGGPEPNWSGYSKLGKGLCEVEKERRLAEQPEPEPEPEPEPPPTGDLTWRPPGWNGGDPRATSSYPGFSVLGPVTGNVSLNMNDSTDYFVQLGAASWVGSGSRTTIALNGGRHVVIVGGSINYTQAVDSDDMTALFIEAGNPAGIVHIEGVNIINSVNAFTIRSPRIVQIQNVRATCKVIPPYMSQHPDVIQTWRGHQCQGIRVDGLTAYSNFTYLSDLTDISTPYGVNAPLYWELHNVDMHPIAGEGYNNWMGSPGHATFRGSNNWIEGSIDSAGNTRALGDQLRQYGEQYSPKAAAFEYHDSAGALVYTSPDPPQHGSAPNNYGKRQGDRIRYARRPLLNQMEWRWGKPTVADGADASGNFVPASAVGTGYVSPGYK